MPSDAPSAGESLLLAYQRWKRLHNADSGTDTPSVSARGGLRILVLRDDQELLNLDDAALVRSVLRMVATHRGGLPLQAIVGLLEEVG